MMTFEEIGEVLGCSKASAQNTYMRALAKLRRFHPELRGVLDAFAEIEKSSSPGQRCIDNNSPDDGGDFEKRKKRKAYLHARWLDKRDRMIESGEMIRKCLSCGTSFVPRFDQRKCCSPECQQSRKNQLKIQRKAKKDAIRTIHPRSWCRRRDDLSPIQAKGPPVCVTG